eukprot:8044229-Pyramimonas_sp.AAC.1
MFYAIDYLTMYKATSWKSVEYLEAQLGEKPAVLAGLEALLEEALHLLQGSLLLRGVLCDVGGDGALPHIAVASQHLLRDNLQT